jgi:catechol 2,3-dioxygenase-like lactoylglutathione lyase family enzyme
MTFMPFRSEWRGLAALKEQKSMSSSSITGISHAILWVRDLDAAAATYRRLGFTLGQYYLHPKSVGTANYNAMFEDDYLELLTPIEKNERNAARLARLDAEGDGLKDLSLATKDADAAYVQVKSAGLSPLPVFEHHRPEGDEQARFRIVYLPPDQLLPGLGIHVNQRVTPELMWRGANTKHANGTRGIAGLVSVAPDPAAMAAPFGVFYANAPVRGSDGSLSVKAGKSTMRFVDPALAAALFPSISFRPKPPFVAALELFVDDPAKTRTFFAGAGVQHRSASDGAVEIPSIEACGVMLRFVKRTI